MAKELEKGPSSSNIVCPKQKRKVKRRENPSLEEEVVVVDIQKDLEVETEEIGEMALIEKGKVKKKVKDSIKREAMISLEETREDTDKEEETIRSMRSQITSHITTKLTQSKRSNLLITEP